MSAARISSEGAGETSRWLRRGLLAVAALAASASKCLGTQAPDAGPCSERYGTVSWTSAKFPAGENLSALWVSDGWPASMSISGNPSEVWAVSDEGHIFGLGPFAEFFKLFDAQTPLHAVWGSSTGEVWVVGDGGAMLRWRSPNPTTQWEAVPSGVTTRLSALGGTGADDVWAAGDDAVLLHWSGTAWAVVAPSNVPAGVGFSSLWVAGADDVWLSSTEAGILYRYASGAWTTVDLALALALRALAGTSPSDGWVVGDKGFIAHWDGVRWAPVQGSSTANLHGVWAGAPSAAWAVGDEGTTEFFDGLRWFSISSRSTQQLRCVGGGFASRTGTGTSLTADGRVVSTWAGGTASATLAFSQATLWVCQE